MGSTTLTDGTQVGLAGPCPPSLNGLALVRDSVCHLATDSMTPALIGGGLADAEVGGVPEVGGAPAPTFMLWSLGTGQCMVDPTVPFANRCFPDLYPNFALVNPVVIDPTELCGRDQVWLPDIGVKYHVVVQAVSNLGADGWVLSTPSVIDVLPQNGNGQ